MGRPKRGDTLSLTIEDLAFGGEGVGRVGGYVVFVRGGLPGDRLRVRLVEARGRFGRGLIEAVEEPSAERVDAPCPYFGRCGGCRLQHMAYPAQLAYKAKQVADCLARLGGVAAAELRAILPAPAVWGYRNKMEFTVGGTADAPIVGLHEADRYDAVLDVERCLIQPDALNLLLQEARREVRERALPPYDQGSGEGVLRYLMLRHGRRTGEVMANIVAASPAIETLSPVAEGLRTRVPGAVSVMLNVNAKRASVAVGSEEHLLAGRDHINESLGGLTFQVSANSFFQTNTEQAERLFDLVLEASQAGREDTAIDLYSGTGAISLLLARRCRRVYGIEVTATAVEDAVRNARVNRIENCTFLTGEVRHVLPDLIRDGVRADVVVADPPRAGFHPKALRALAALAPARIVYVSCNPPTLARDVGDLARSGYRVDWVQPVDMFPHTPHIEAIARLTRG